MTKTVGPQPNTNYLKSAVAQIYGEEDDFILIGLTGRTGSGCSTAASILRSAKASIKHSLFTGNNPESNEKRKERIVFRHFNATWIPFLLIQVRSLITTFLLDDTTEKAIDSFGHLIPDQETRDGFINLLNELQGPYREISKGAATSDATSYYTQTLPDKCDAIKKLLGDSGFVKLYQEVGKNIRLSGNPYDRSLAEGKFFTLAERINTIVKQIHTN